MGKDYVPRDFIIAERAWEAIYDPIRAIRTEEYKYIVNFCPGWPIQVPPAYARKVGLELMEELYGTPRPHEELYNLKEDPYELRNLAESPEYQDIKNELRAKLYSILEEDGDEVLSLSAYMTRLKEHSRSAWKKKGSRFCLEL